MSSTIPSIDISRLPDLIRLVEELKSTNQPRLLKKDSKPVAMLLPVGHTALESFDFQPLEIVKQNFHDAGYSEIEVNDMLEALSELPQYADQSIRKS